MVSTVVSYRRRAVRGQDLVERRGALQSTVVLVCTPYSHRLSSREIGESCSRERESVCRAEPLSL